MDIYNYDAPTGEYIGASKADPDPLEEGSWLIPAYATTSSPPKVKAGMTAVFDGSAWTLVEDHRGRSGWIDGRPATIADLGPLPDGWSDDAPLPTPAEMREAKRAEIISRLAAIDQERIRPLAAVALNQADDFDIQKLNSLEKEAFLLRAELALVVVELF